MKQRILYGWNWIRVIYLIAGIMIIVQSAIARQLAGVLFGAYFAIMGLFALGCAAGNCYVNSNAGKTENDIPEHDLSTISYQEIKER